MCECNEFLLGMNEGLENLPDPPKMQIDVSGDTRVRQSMSTRYIMECKDHYEQHSRLVMRKIGAYIKSVFAMLERMNYMGGVDTSAE